MATHRIVYIIPGHNESHTRQKDYDRIGKLFEAQGITPIHIEIDWHRKKHIQFKEYVSEFLKQFKKPKGSKIYILGFSYGAVISFLSATKTKPSALILCSLSPFFVEDYKSLEPHWLKWWKKQYFDSDFSFNELAPKIKTRVYIVVGGNEHHSCLRRARLAQRKLSKSTLTISKDAPHRVGNKKYLIGLKKVIEQL